MRQGHLVKPGDWATGAPSSPSVQITLLGGFRVVVGGQTLGGEAWQRKSARQLFKYLLSRPYRRASRVQAIEFLWPDSDPVAGAANLRPTLTALRHALNHAIVADREYISVRHSPELWVDADTFEHAITHPWPADSDHELARLEEASRLYTGDYLPDDEFEEANGRREALKRRWAPLRLKLARLQEERGDTEGAIQTLERAMQLDSNDEDAALELMRLLGSRGRRADAMRVFEQVKRHLADDLDVQPSELLIEMRQRLLAQRTLTSSPRSADLAGSLAPEPVRVVDSSPTNPTVILVRFNEREAIAGNAMLEHHIAEHGGQVFQHTQESTQSRSCFGVFHRAEDAVSLASQIQHERRVNADPTAPEAARVAVYTADSTPLTVNDLDSLFAACEQLAAAAQPGQVLLSARSVIDFVNDGARLTGSTLIDMGDHRLRPNSQVERIFQLSFLDMPGGLPRLAGSTRLPFGLPHDPPRLIGRDAEVQQIIELLQHVRLVLLAGAGGIGKSRLALHVAHTLREEFTDDACFVSLETIIDPDLVAPAIANRLGIVDTGGRFLTERLAGFLRTKQILLVLDNFEQVASETGSITRMLRECPGLKILITSQKLLDLDPEYGLNYEVPPLEVPGPRACTTAAELDQFSATRMFVERARAARSDFNVTESDAEAVAEICRRLEGLPLAIELAAARVRMMRPAEMTQLKSLLPLLASGPGARIDRHRTLRASISWSFHLLLTHAQVLFARLSTFAGGFTLEAAEQVGAGTSTDAPLETRVLDGIGELITMSLLVRRDDGQGSRYRMLEMIREYGLEVLDAGGEAQMVLRRHAMYYLGRARQAEMGLRGPDQPHALAELAAEYDNIRSALRWARQSHEDDLDIGLELATRIWRFWVINGHLSEGRAWLEDALDHQRSVDARVLAGALVAAGELACAAGDLRSAMRHSERSLALYRAMEDKKGIAHSLHIRGYSIASRAQTEADYVEAALLHQECLELERRRGDRVGVAKAQHELGEIARYRQHHDDAWSRLHEAWQERKRLADAEGEGWSAHCLAWVAYERGENLTLAREWADRALSIWESFPAESGHAKSATLSLRARIVVELGDRRSAAADVVESLRLWPPLRDTEWLIYDLHALALVAISPEPTPETAHCAVVFLSAAGTLHDDDSRPAKHRRREPLQIWNRVRPHLTIEARRAARWAGKRMDAEAAHAYASDIARRLSSADCPVAMVS